MFFPFSRIIALLMGAVLCFALLVPMSLARHNAALAVFIVAVFFAYVVANVALWQRTRRRE
jgi:amino acid transporter